MESRGRNGPEFSARGPVRNLQPRPDSVRHTQFRSPAQPSPLGLAAYNEWRDPQIFVPPKRKIL